MTEKLKQTIEEEVMKLPKDAQEVINNFDWTKISEEIGKKYLLNESEINDLQVETLLVLAGIENVDYYAQNIENEVGTSKDEAEKISEEIFQKIFTPINDILIENIKKNPKNKNPNWKQSLDFILSGGDYSAFVAPTTESVGVPTFSQSVGKERREISPSPLQGEGRGEVYPPRSDLGRSTPEVGNNTPPVKPPNLAEIKDNLVM